MKQRSAVWYAAMEAKRIKAMEVRFSALVDAAIQEGKVSRLRLLGMCVQAYYQGYRARNTAQRRQRAA